MLSTTTRRASRSLMLPARTLAQTQQRLSSSSSLSSTVPIKKQITPATLWQTNVRAPPESVDPAAFISDPATRMYEQVPYIKPRASSVSEQGSKSAGEETATAGTTTTRAPRLLKCVLSMRRTVKVTSGGKVASMSAMVVVGNGKGAAGYGEGKDLEAPNAVRKATEKAIKNMVFIDRYDDRTILHDIAHTFKATQVQMRAAPAGFGIRANGNIHEICRCAGINDLGAKVHGSRNPINVIKATFQAFEKQKTPEQLARDRGLKVVDVRKLAYGRQ
ncbi:28S ribosomal protein S5, mitochondrial [Sorochytrium milnesiophthora]